MLIGVRIIAGHFRSRTIDAPPGLATRPTSDRLRETLFNVLAPRIFTEKGGAAFLDLYAGSGAVGIEALSRGAARVVFVERAPAALKVLRGNLERLGLADSGIAAGFRIHAGSVGGFLRRSAQKPEGREKREDCEEKRERNEAKREQYEEIRELYEVVFLDPPYDAATEYAATLGLLGGASASLLAPDALVIAEHRRKEKLEERYGSLERTRLLEQGDAALSFYALAAQQQD
jgi:16S rRNA (guanine966-N2)-methyltransferase